MMLADQAPNLVRALNNLARAIDSYVGAPAPNDNVIRLKEDTPSNDCDECGGKGWDFYLEEDTELVRLQRCDICRLYKTDEDAATVADPLLQAFAGRVIKKG